MRSEVESAEFKLLRRAVQKKAETLRNPRNNERPFYLSSEDIDVVTAAVTHAWEVTTVDKELIAFLSLQYDLEAVEPLHLVNNWLEGGLITWDDNRHAVVEDWLDQNEKPQSPAEIRRFEKLTGRRYPQWDGDPGPSRPARRG
ncbi:MAG: hypothetical protein A3K19_20760 [Lentisphaerae bacterium RIFOXYB12_FULL_65_16]|nr:MAG: hypothetical protein A3K18_19185 [Lentisphaerae bacterium RIFOXYA12_64_32]OGV85218.1 MAG: hypothetical protein A3K19_20760 [Lentisphaerae bacterium RIFOXYB12_FULL_65_16]